MKKMASVALVGIAIVLVAAYFFIENQKRARSASPSRKPSVRQQENIGEPGKVDNEEAHHGNLVNRVVKDAGTEIKRQDTKDIIVVGKQKAGDVVGNRAEQREVPVLTEKIDHSRDRPDLKESEEPLIYPERSRRVPSRILNAKPRVSFE
jgi:hypothetical protein